MSEVLTTTIDIAAFDDLQPERGVAAVVESDYVALFRIGDDVFAIDHVEPFTHMPVLARGIVGSVGDRIAVASPLHKQRFDLRSGECLDDPDVRVRTWPVEVVDGRVRIHPHPNQPAEVAP